LEIERVESKTRYLSYFVCYEYTVKVIKWHHYWHFYATDCEEIQYKLLNTFENLLHPRTTLMKTIPQDLKFVISPCVKQLSWLRIVHFGATHSLVLFAINDADEDLVWKALACCM